HHLRDEPIDRCNGCLRFASAKQCRTMDIPRGEVGQRARPEIFVLNAHRTSGAWREGGMLATAGLETRFLVGRDDEFIGAQRNTLPSLGIQVQDTAGSLRKLRVTRKDPAAMSPGLQRIRTQPPPERDTT